MLDQIFTAHYAAARLRLSPLGPWLDSFVERLSGLGYTTGTCREYVVLAADLGRWMADCELSTRALDESAIGSYIEHRGTDHDRRRWAADRMLEHLRAERAAAPREIKPDHSALTTVCQRYAEYMLKERGAADGTIEGYIAVIRDFLDRRFKSGDVNVGTIKTSDIEDYIVGRASALAAKTVAYLASALRSFFRFLFIQGMTSTDLSRATLVAKTASQASVPRYLSPEEVDRLLETCDSRTPAGRRNRAIILLLVRLGLRASEVAALDLDDIRWRSSEIVVRGKGNVVDRLPLLSEVGEALALYLSNDRLADVPTRRLFLRLFAPVRGLNGRGAISSVVRAGLERAGLHPPVRGPHLLRHTLGTQMIRDGAAMTEIAEVLRHRSLSSTAIYAKVDFETLRCLAQPWPSVGGAR